MKTLKLLITSLFLMNIVNGQMIFKDKIQSVNAITSKSIPIEYQSDKNIFTYNRFDDYGQSKAVIYYEGNLIRSISFYSDDPTQPLLRLKDVFRHSPKGDNPEADNPNVLITSNTIYYSGRARHEARLDYNNRRFAFIITLLD